MSMLAARRCFNHARREAAAQCTGCGNYYCRECVTEHDGRMICASCLSSQTDNRRERPILSRLLTALQLLLGIVIIWSSFYYLGKALLVVPSQFHESTLWNFSRSIK